VQGNGPGGQGPDGPGAERHGRHLGAVAVAGAASMPVRVRAAADRALTATMPSLPMPRMADAVRVASAVATRPAGKVTAPTTAALAVSTAHRAGVAARVVRMLPVANSPVMARAAWAAMATVTTTAATRLP
jgi:hypothetical protein